MKIYTCPMHPEIRQNKQGECPKCHMKLVTESEVADSTKSETEYSYLPLIIIISLIILVTAILALHDLLTASFHWQTVMLNFMAGFFLVFSGFKLLDLKGFAEGYVTYDLLAQKVYAYGYIYPFIELSLGLLYMVKLVPPIISIVTFLLMALSGVGVVIKLAKHEKFQCACLGTLLKVPLTKVTLVEDFGMAIMALVMLYFKGL